MNTLTISQVFSQISSFQENYLAILDNPTWYYTAVEGASIHIWPFKAQALCLGDLLQLWFAEKWLLRGCQEFDLAQYLAAIDVKTVAQQGYIYAIKGNAISGVNQSTVWFSPECSAQVVAQTQSLKALCEFLNCDRPFRPQQFQSAGLEAQF